MCLWTGPWSSTVTGVRWWGSRCYGYAGVSPCAAILSLHLKCLCLKRRSGQTRSSSIHVQNNRKLMVVETLEDISVFKSGNWESSVLNFFRLNLVLHHQIMTTVFFFHWFVTLLNKHCNVHLCSFVIIVVYQWWKTIPFQ